MAREETLMGHIVLTVNVFGHSDPDGQAALGEDNIARLNELHLRKIDLADKVVAITPQGYMGEGLARELRYSIRALKPIRFVGMEPTLLVEMQRELMK